MPAKTKDQFAELCAAFPLRPIRTEARLRAAEAVAHTILRKSSTTEDEEDYLESLSALMHEYEAVHHPDDAADVSWAETLRFMIETNNVTQAEVARATGIPITSLSEMVRGKRGIGPEHATAIATYFNLNPAVFLPRTAKGHAG